MEYLNTGQIAKLAGVSKRTIQYYDRYDLLKPSSVNDKGYRFYTNKDLFKLQKILSLKYFGLSLSEIKDIVDVDSNRIYDSLLIQKKLLIQKISEMSLIADTIDDILISYKEKSEVDWQEFMELTRLFAKSRDVSYYYQNSNNLNIRINFHQKYQSNKLEWFPFLKSKINLKGRVLEIGCGSGNYWLNYQAKDLIKNEIILSDKSEGMLNEAKENLKNYNFNYQILDLNDLNGSLAYDTIIINHTLFFADDINLTLRKLSQNIKEDTTLYISTYGSQHMKEIRELVSKFDRRIKLSNINYYEVFGIENGKELLNKYFDEVNLYLYDDYLLVSDIDDMLDYILSCNGNQNEILKGRIAEFRQFLLNEVKGSYRINKACGLFSASKKKAYL